MKARIAIFISGRGSNMEAIVTQTQHGILQECCDIVLVFANKPDAPGLRTAQQYGLKIAFVESQGKKREDFDRQVIALLEPYRLDYIVLAGYMRILSPLFVERYRNRIINIHPADTKAYQGIHGYEWAFEHKLETTKITVHFVDEGVDTGTILDQREVDLRGADSLEEIERRGLQVEHEFYSNVLRRVFGV